MAIEVNPGKDSLECELLFDVCVFCALAEEAKAFLEATAGLCKVSFQQGFSKSNNREYRQSVIKNNLGEPLRMHVSWPPGYGPIETSLHMKATLDEFQPRFAVMTGICAGDRRKVKLGDLVVAERAFTYDNGMIVTGEDGRKEHLYDVDTRHPDQTLLQYVRMFFQWNSITATLPRPVSKRQQCDWLLCRLLDIPSHRFDDLNMAEVGQFAPDWRKIVRDLQQGQDPILSKERILCNPSAIQELAFGQEEFPFKDSNAPECHIAPIASGSAVRGDDPFSDVRYPVRKTVAIDMESAAFYRAAADYPGLRSLLVKGVADYADEDKDDSFHHYASVLSALYILSFIKEYANSKRMPRLALKTPGEGPQDHLQNTSFRNGSYFTAISNNAERASHDEENLSAEPIQPSRIFELSDPETEVKSLILDARSAATKEGALKTLFRAQSLCDQIVDRKMGCSLLVEVTTELTEETMLPSRRHELWKECFRRCVQGIEEHNEPSLVDLFAKKAVDFIQDVHVFVLNSDANHLLSLVRKSIDGCIKDLPPNERSPLLVRKSALLRNMSQFRATGVAKERMSQESLRCAEKAINDNPNSWSAHLEQALAFWHLAQFDKTHRDYNARIEAAEESFWDSITLQPTAYNLLSMCNFFRMTYQAVPCLEVFDLYAKTEHDKRGFLRGCFMFGEAVMQLWYAGHPWEITDLYLKEADTLLQLAINSECEEARHIVDLAFIKAARGELAVGVDLINTLHSLSKSTAWTDVAEFVIKSKSEDDLISRGFALGVSDSAIWNKLGTFAISFLQDSLLAIQLYRQSLALNKSNAVAMTNLARALLSVESDGALQEANMWISKAASCADRRFSWWRNVRDQIREKMNPYQGQVMGRSPEDAPLKLGKMSDLHRSFQILKAIDDVDIRNGGLRKLIERILKISLANSSKHLKIDVNPRHNSIIRVDAGFYFFEKHLYRIESVWQPEPIDATAIDSFAQTLDYTRKGLFVSISGFSEAAIKKASELRRDCQILLMDGAELETILQGSPSFEEVIQLKQLSFGKELNPYFRIRPTQQLEVYEKA